MSYNLPTKITKDVWFYEANKEILEKYLGVPYVSYSTVTAFGNPSYFDGFIKSKFAGIRDEGSVYTKLGSFLGESIEKGVWQDNPEGFKGLENLNLEDFRDENAEYEKFVLVDFGDFILIGFIDKAVFEECCGYSLEDYKSGSASKLKDYLSDDYVQLVLYAHALEEMGYNIKSIGVRFIERVGSHINSPLAFSGRVEKLPLTYSPNRVEFARKKVIKAVKAISDLYTTKVKIFGEN